MRDAVFTSMDLPPLFPYMYRAEDPGHYYEDGGVVDNLPVWFATNVEECDLLFILPLNASLEEPVNQTSIVNRLLASLTFWPWPRIFKVTALAAKCSAASSTT